MAFTCILCQEENVTDIAQLDNCTHRFCFSCTTRWSQIDTRCPLCKERFTTITHRSLAGASPSSSGSEDARETDAPLGKVMAVLQVPERTQRPDTEGEFMGSGSDEDDDPMDAVFCIECGGGDDESSMLLCDGCDRACHTYCANLPGVPEGEWYCQLCAEDPDAPEPDEEPRSASQGAPGGSGRPGAYYGTRSRGRAARASHPGSGAATRRSSSRGEPPVQGRGGDAQGSSAALSSGALSPGEGRPRQRRRLARRPGGPVDAGSVGDLLDVLAARADNHSVGELPSIAHRRIEDLRRNWDELRAGNATFLRSSGGGSGSAAAPTTPPQPAGGCGGGAPRGASDDNLEASWATFQALRRHQAAEAEGGGSSSAIRRRLALAAAEGRQLGPSGRLTRGPTQRRPHSRGRLPGALTQPAARGSSPRRAGTSARTSSPRRADAQARRSSPRRAGALPGREQPPSQARPHAGRRPPLSQQAAGPPGHSRLQQQLDAAARPSAHGGDGGVTGSPPARLGRHTDCRGSMGVPAPYHGDATPSRPGTKQPAHGQVSGQPAWAGAVSEQTGNAQSHPVSLPPGVRAPPMEPVLASATRGANSGDSSASQAALTSEPARGAPVPQALSWERCAPPPPQPPPSLPLQGPERQQQGQPHQRQAAHARVFASKHDAAAHVKDLLKPLYAKGMVTRDQFREAARAATHALFRHSSGGPDAARTVRQAAQALAEALSELDLPRAAVAVLHAR